MTKEEKTNVCADGGAEFTLLSIGEKVYKLSVGNITYVTPVISNGSSFYIDTNGHYSASDTNGHYSASIKFKNSDNEKNLSIPESGKFTLITENGLCNVEYDKWNKEKDGFYTFKVLNSPTFELAN